jgi:hypothetical protein
MSGPLEFSVIKGNLRQNSAAIANRNFQIIMSNKQFEKKFVLSDSRDSYQKAYPDAIKTGTYIAYAEGGKAPGSAIRYTDKQSGITYTFDVPVEYWHEKNVILVVEHGFLQNGEPIYSLQNDGKKSMLVVVSDQGKIDCLQNFPAKYGWFFPDDKHGIPLGEESYKGIPSTRFLYREEGSFCGRIIRGFDSGLADYLEREVYANMEPFWAFDSLVRNATVKVKNL